MIRANRPVRSRIYLAKIHPTYVSRCLSPRTAIYMRRTATLSPRNPSSNEIRSEEHTSELQSLMRISYAVFCLKKKKILQSTQTQSTPTSLPPTHTPITPHIQHHTTT